MTVVLTLGPLLFSDFEVPEEVNFGGEQSLVVKRLVGGDRVVQAMGRDDDDIKWSGRFRGSAAELRARLGDYTRIQGQQLVLAWSSFRYLVVVKSFRADFRQQYEIPYNIVCTVIKDLTSPLVNELLDIDSVISSDISGAVEAGAQLGIPGISTAISGVTTATTSVESFEGAGTSVVAGVQGAIGVAQNLIGIQTTSLNTTVASQGNVASVAAGGDPSAMSSGLLAQSDAFSQLAQLGDISSLLSRASINIASAAGGTSGASSLSF